MHDYLLAKQRKQEEFWLRKYGKVLQPAPPSVGKPAPNPKLPPLSGSPSAYGSSYPNSERSINLGGAISAEPSGPASGFLPPIANPHGHGAPRPPAGMPPPGQLHHRHQPKGQAPIFHAQEPVKDFFSRNAKQPRVSAANAIRNNVNGDYSSAIPTANRRPPEPYRKGAPRPGHLPPMAGEHSYGSPPSQQPSGMLGSEASAYSRQQQEAGMYQNGVSPGGYAEGGGSQGAGPRGSLPPLAHEASAAGLSGAGGSQYHNKPLRNLELELSVIRVRE